MAEERITTVEPNDGTPTTTHTTIVRDAEPRSSGGSGWIIAVVLILALVVGIVLFTQMSGSELAKDNAIANAADEVGNAAGAVGNAAGQVGNAVENAADKVAP